MAFSQIVYSGQNSGRGPSPIIWSAGQYPVELVRENPNFGAEFWDDFLTVSGTATTFASARVAMAGDRNYVAYGGATTFGKAIPVASATTVTPVAATAIGALKVTPLAAAHDNFAMEPGGFTEGTTTTGAGVGAPTPVGLFAVGGTLGQLPKIAFEAKIQLDAVDATQCMFIGLAEPNMTAINTMFTGADAFGTKSQIGFWTVASSAVIAGYNKNGQTAVAVGSTGTLVAATYTKLGFLYDPTDSVNGVLRFYQDGVLLGKVMTPPASTAFPSNIGLVPLLYIQNAGAGGAARSLTIDWWRTGVLIDQP